MDPQFLVLTIAPIIVDFDKIKRDGIPFFRSIPPPPKKKKKRKSSKLRRVAEIIL